MAALSLFEHRVMPVWLPPYCSDLNPIERFWRHTSIANKGGLSAATLFYPQGVFYDPSAKVLWVADHDNNRVLMYGDPFTYFSPTSNAASDGWVLESTATSNVAAARTRLGNSLWEMMLPTDNIVPSCLSTLLHCRITR